MGLPLGKVVAHSLIHRRCAKGHAPSAAILLRIDEKMFKNKGLS
jgi:hypothetical protein